MLPRDAARAGLRPDAGSPANEWWDCRPARRDRFWEAAAPPAKTASEATRRATAGPPPEPPPQGSVGIARRRGGKRIGRDEGAGIRFEASSCPILPGCAHHSVLSIGSFSRQSGGRWRRRRRKGGGHSRRWSRPPPPPAEGWSPSPLSQGRMAAALARQVSRLNLACVVRAAAVPAPNGRARWLRHKPIAPRRCGRGASAGRPAPPAAGSNP